VIMTFDFLNPCCCDRLAGISQNVINETVGQSRKWLRAGEKAKGHHFEHLLDENRLFSDLPRKIASFSSQIIKSK